MKAWSLHFGDLGQWSRASVGAKRRVRGLFMAVSEFVGSESPPPTWGPLSRRKTGQCRW